MTNGRIHEVWVIGPLAVCVLCGCASPNLGPGAPDTDPAITATDLLGRADTSPFHTLIVPATERKNGAAQTPVALVTHFDVLRVDVPFGTVSTSGKLWNHIDEDVLPPETIALLQRNGLRIGRGRPESWPPVKALLDAIRGAVSSEHSLEIRNPYPLILEMDQAAHDQTLFVYRRDGTLMGETRPASRNRFRIAHAMNIDRMDEVLLEVVPEVREGRPRRQWQRTEQGHELVPVFRGRILGELAARVAVPPGYFVLIGPSPEAAMSSLVGGAFLSREVEGKRVETLLFITPRLFRAGGLGM